MVEQRDMGIYGYILRSGAARQRGLAGCCMAAIRLYDSVRALRGYPHEAGESSRSNRIQALGAESQ